MLPTRIEGTTRYDLFFMDRKETGIPGRFLPLPRRNYRNKPVYWQRASDPGYVEISTIATGPFLGHGREIRVPAWARSEADLDRLEQGFEENGEILNAIGWSLSFHWRDVSDPDWARSPQVKWGLARAYFERAAEQGAWAGLNNLGVMYKNGFGVEQDLPRAFKLFEKAAQGLDPIPLRHMEGCLRHGRGIATDGKQADYLAQLADLQEKEQGE